MRKFLYKLVILLLMLSFTAETGAYLLLYSNTEYAIADREEDSSKEEKKEKDGEEKDKSLYCFITRTLSFKTRLYFHYNTEKPAGCCRRVPETPPDLV